MMRGREEKEGKLDSLCIVRFFAVKGLFLIRFGLENVG